MGHHLRHQDKLQKKDDDHHLLLDLAHHHLRHQDKLQEKDDDHHLLLDPHPGGMVEILEINEIKEIQEIIEIFVIVEIPVKIGIKAHLYQGKKERRIKAGEKQDWLQI